MSSFERGIQSHLNRISRTFRSSNISDEEKISILLSIFINKPLLKIALAELNPDKTVTLSGRVFHLVNDFEARNKDHIDSENLLRIHLNKSLNIRTPRNQNFELMWFEALVTCLRENLLPANLDIETYKSFSKKELNSLIRGEIVNIIEAREDIEYLSSLACTSVKHLIFCYNALHRENPWHKKVHNTNTEEIQLALGIDPPIDLSTSTVEDTTIYLRSRFNIDIKDVDTFQNINSKIPWVIPKPKDFNEILRFHRENLTIRFNTQQRNQRQWLANNCMSITEETFRGERSSLAISKKIKYIYKFKNIEHLTPRGITNRAPLNLLEDELEYIKSV